MYFMGNKHKKYPGKIITCRKISTQLIKCQECNAIINFITTLVAGFKNKKFLGQTLEPSVPWGGRGPNHWTPRGQGSAGRLLSLQPCCAAPVPRPWAKPSQLVLTEEPAGSSRLLPAITPPARPWLYLTAQQEGLVRALFLF